MKRAIGGRVERFHVNSIKDAMQRIAAGAQVFMQSTTKLPALYLERIGGRDGNDGIRGPQTQRQWHSRRPVRQASPNALKAKLLEEGPP